MTVRLSVVGAGLVGRQHLRAITAAEGVSLASIVEPDASAKILAAEYAVPHYHTLEDMIATDRPDGVILATPNHLHVDMALTCIKSALPTLIEKPLATDVAGALTIVKAGQVANVPLLTGHHRRHNPLIAKAKEVVENGSLGIITSVHSNTWLYKHDDYFKEDWRTRTGAGPVYINLIHDIDLLRYLCGEVASVHAMESNAVRGNDVEDTAVLLLKFVNGALGTMNISDTIVAPWSWELTARENPAYPATTETCYHIGGTQGSLALPNFSLWKNKDVRSWWEPISSTTMTFGFDSPLVNQAKHLGAVIRGEAEPLVSAVEGYRNQLVLKAVKDSAESGKTVNIAPN